jgi:hypothetical protein
MGIKKKEIQYTKDGLTLIQTEKFEYEKSIFVIGDCYFRLDSCETKKLDKFQNDSEKTEKKNGKTIFKETVTLTGAPSKWLFDNGYKLAPIKK